MSLTYFANTPKYLWKRSTCPPKVEEPNRYQPLCCALSGITKRTREALSRLPEYILKGDPRYDIICRCPCHASDIKEHKSMIINDNQKLIIEKPIPPVVSADMLSDFVIQKYAKQNTSNNNSVMWKLPAPASTPVHRKNMVINLTADTIMARYLLYSLLLLSSASLSVRVTCEILSAVLSCQAKEPSFLVPQYYFTILAFN